MVSLVIVMFDERLDLPRKVAGQKVVFQQYPILQGLVPAFDFALRLRVVRCTTDVAHVVVTEPVSQVARDVTGAIVGE
jgi:hypothetical protein